MTKILPAVSISATPEDSRTNLAGTPTWLDVQLVRKASFQLIYGEESIELHKQVKALTKRLEEGCSCQSEIVWQFNTLRDYLRSIVKQSFTEKIQYPSESVAEFVKILRSDIDVIFEHGMSIQNSNIELGQNKTKYIFILGQ